MTVRHRGPAGALVALLLSTTSHAQSVLVAPNVIVIDSRAKTTAITLVNNGSGPVEVALSMSFGYPVSNAGGEVRLQTFDPVDDSLPSAAGFIQAYPSELVMAPGSRRVVRLLASPPADQKDGEYWARLVVTTRAARTTKVDDGGASPGSAEIGINLEIRSLLPVFFRQGAMETRVLIDSVDAHVDGDSLRVRVPMQRAGNAAFVGSVRVTVRDGVGSIRDTHLMPLGVYYALSPRIALNARGLRPGVYYVEVEAITSRPDVTQPVLIQAAPVTARVAVQLAARTP